MQQNYQNHSPEVQLKLVSTTNSESESTLKPRPEVTGPKCIDPNRKGDYWEYHVGMAAWDRKGEVFKNLGKTGRVDLVLEVGGTYYPIDVKVDKWEAAKAVWRAGGTPAENVWLVCVNPETRNVRWPQKQGGGKTPVCPPGLEDYWD